MSYFYAICLMLRHHVRSTATPPCGPRRYLQASKSSSCGCGVRPARGFVCRAEIIRSEETTITAQRQRCKKMALATSDVQLRAVDFSKAALQQLMLQPEVVFAAIQRLLQQIWAKSPEDKGRPGQWCALSRELGARRIAYCVEYVHRSAMCTVGFQLTVSVRCACFCYERSTRVL